MAINHVNQLTFFPFFSALTGCKINNSIHRDSAVFKSHVHFQQINTKKCSNSLRMELYKTLYYENK